MTKPREAPRIPIAVLASGRGTNFDAIATAIREGKLQAEIVAVVSDRADAPVLQKARDQGLNAIHVPSLPQTNSETKRGGSLADKIALRVDHEKRILAELSKWKPRFLVLAGYMRIMTPHLIEAFRSERGYSRIVNVHPSLLPAFPGVESYAQAFRYGTKIAGVTIHLVEAEVDSGPICAQQSFSIEDCQSTVDVEKKGLAIEHRLYPETLGWVLPEEFSVRSVARSIEGSNTALRPLGRLCVFKN
jgi:phosphoribosylglycinamide formyltransferase-1